MARSRAWTPGAYSRVVKSDRFMNGGRVNRATNLCCAAVKASTFASDPYRPFSISAISWDEHADVEARCKPVGEDGHIRPKMSQRDSR